MPLEADTRVRWREAVMNFWLWVLLGIGSVAGYGAFLDRRRRTRHEVSGDPSQSLRRAQGHDESRGAAFGGGD
jgi:hypothetical protein